MEDHHVQVEALMMDQRFQRWVQHGAPADEAFWQQWMTQHPDQREAVQEARKAIRRMALRTTTVTSAETEQQLAQLNKRLDALSTPTRTLIRWPIAVAAAITLVLMTLGGWVFLLTPVRYETAYGEIQTVSLPDGSIVTLNSHSQLSHARLWRDDTSRNVTLEGEAFFQVSHQEQAGRPVKFIVTTPDIQIQVIGTEFNVNTRRKRTQVVLESGHVELALANGTGVAMQPGDLVEYSSQQQALTKQAVNPQDFIRWRDHMLHFDHVTLAELGKIIEEKYGQPVVVIDSTLRQRNISGTIPADDLEFLLEACKETFGIQIQHHNDTLFLR
ncbi:ferric-dicitrate binding protein FerR, regulates iron transport through sigma-19 [Catalinimonas alkaloidigena]|uniref:Ferric-dicitrate binding protein FerR, regulates iron transport through sigma-19 n=1 Tax=Catalinimonas alkaloidigena TaxID=1075417 RepID=A0A1G9HSF3_9BACT|nr:FecR domain-containing protein [Catalinimonas alkaloidigena]SDL15644.1 ferric-dicitrate binding protein FerR, regulates iron transport through sigma-19 [Catalinimonas alkaloidigena]